MAKKKHGTTNDDFTLNVDLAPTILNATGNKIPKGMQGTDVAPLYLAEKAPEWRDEFYYEHPTISNANRIPTSEALVRKDLKYFYYPEHSVEQLFDISKDPREENDLIKHPAYKEKLVEMRKRFKELKAAAK